MSDRHPKWVRVEPGTTIPAGQPYRTEARDEFPNSDRKTACEFANGPGEPLTVDGLYDGEAFTMLVDSSWEPPLDLPTEPTWGIALTGATGIQSLGKWRVIAGGDYVTCDQGYRYPRDYVRDFIPLTDEQVARIEAAR